MQLTANVDLIANVETRALVTVAACVCAKAAMGPSVPVETSASAHSQVYAASVPHAVSIIIAKICSPPYPCHPIPPILLRRIPPSQKLLTIYVLIYSLHCTPFLPYPSSCLFL